MQNHYILLICFVICAEGMKSDHVIKCVVSQCVQPRWVELKEEIL